jgi:hypothetical protein
MGDEDLTWAGFLSTVEDSSQLKDGLVHLGEEPDGGLTLAAARWGRAAWPLALDKGGCRRRGGTKES